MRNEEHEEFAFLFYSVSNLRNGVREHEAICWLREIFPTECDTLAMFAAVRFNGRVVQVNVPVFIVVVHGWQTEGTPTGGETVEKWARANSAPLSKGAACRGGGCASQPLTHCNILDMRDWHSCGEPVPSRVSRSNLLIQLYCVQVTPIKAKIHMIERQHATRLVREAGFGAGLAKGWCGRSHGGWKAQAGRKRLDPSVA